MNKKYYVYVLCTSDGRPFYVGKGQGKRIGDHEKEARRGHRCHKCNKIRKILSAGGTVLRKIVFETGDEREAYQKEMSLIHLIGLNNLTNRLPGGQGKISAPALDKYLCDMSLDEFDLYMRRLRPSKKEHDILVRRWMHVRIHLLTSERRVARGHGNYELGDVLDREINNIYAAYSKPWQERLRF